jgi:virginiamycin B lyase
MINPATHAITESAIPTAVSSPQGITAGPDGNLWFTALYTPAIVRSDYAGNMTMFPLSSGASPQFICAGPDGNVWFTDPGSNSLNRITPAGVITSYTLEYSPGQIATGSDGAIWFTDPEPGRIGRFLTP